MQSKKQKGQQGELLAQKHLQNKGYQLLSQNYRTKLGEIDLIFSHHKTIVFVEVKARNFFTQGIPEEAVTPHKLHKISQVAQEYLLSHHLSSSLWRIDVVAVELDKTPPDIRHHQSVTS